MQHSLYLASAFSRRTELRGYAYRLAFRGYRITSSWLTRAEGDLALTEEGRQQIAYEDFHDLLDADMFVRWSDPEFRGKSEKVPRYLLSGSRMVETGAALMRGKRIFIIGGPQSIFDSTPGICHLKDFPALMSHLMMFYPIQQAA